MIEICILTLAATLALQFYLRRTYPKLKILPGTGSFTGFETTRAIFDTHTLQQVQTEAVKEQRSDHYALKSKGMPLFEENDPKYSVEVNHTLQYTDAYKPLQIRARLVPAYWLRQGQ